MDRQRGNLGTLLVAAAERRSAAPAIVAEDGHVIWSFADLVEAAGRLATGLADLGVEEGDRVVIVEADRRAIYEIVAGVIFAGATVVIPPPSLTPRQALRFVASVEPRAVVASPRLGLPALLEPGLRRAPIRITTGRPRLPGTVAVDVLRRSAPSPPRLVGWTTPAVLSFTSGTTGGSKSIQRTHGVLRHQHEALMALRGLDERDRDLVGVPLVVLQNLAAGVTSVPAPRGNGTGAHGRRVCEATARTGATSAVGFPCLFEAATRAARGGEIAGLRSVHLGGTRVRTGLLEALSAAAPGARATIVYGSTECEPIATIGGGAYLAELARSRPADGVCVGTVATGVELRVTRLGSHSSELAAPGEVGHLEVAGSRVAGDHASGGWVDTGDVGRLDDEGRVWLLGRAANVVGQRFPIAVERAAEALPWVARAAMVRVGEPPAPRAFLAVEPRTGSAGASAGGGRGEAMLLAGELGTGEFPVDVAVVERLPVSRGPGAKVDEARLRRLGAERLRRGSAVRSGPARLGPGGDARDLRLDARSGGTAPGQPPPPGPG